METYEIDLGKVAVRPRGNHTPNPAEPYEALDLVQSGRNFYLALDDIPSGTALTDAKWLCVINLDAEDAALAEMIAKTAVAVAAAASANTAKDNANASSSAAILAAAQANSAKADADSAAAAARAAASEAVNLQAAVGEKLAEMDGIASSVVQQTLGTPYRMELEHLDKISIRNNVPQRIKAQLFPTYNPQNVIFQVRGDSIDIDPDGNITVMHTGVVSVRVIPTDNTRLWKEIQIEVIEPRIRMNGTNIRVANGKMRIN